MLFPNLIEAEFIERINRFVARILIHGNEERAYIKNTGRLKELLFRGNTLYVKEKLSGFYKYEIVLAKAKDFLVCIDSHIASKLYAEYINANVVFEPRFGNHRFDILQDKKVIEVKSVNLVKNGIALFPDAPTKRGTQHIMHLMELAKKGYVPEIVFVIQREDANTFSPNWEMDKSFSTALKEFILRGFTAKAYRCNVSLKEIKLRDEVPILI